MATADHLLDLMYSWIEQRERCAEKLRKLAQELESLREKCNGTECVGSSVSVVGAACLMVAGVATLFTSGAAAPLLGLAGAAYSAVGVTISVAAKITEHFLSSDTMEEARKVDKESNKIAEKIQQLFKQLKAEKKKLSPFADPDELDQHIMTEFLTAIGNRSGVKGQIIVRTVNNEPMFFLDAGPRYKMFNFNVGTNRNEPWRSLGAGQTRMVLSFTHEVTLLVAGILVFFALKNGGKKSKFLFAKGAEQLIKLMSSSAFKTALKGGAMVVGGAVGMAFALSEAIDNWTDLIKKNHVTEASKSLRDTADNILKSTRTLRKLFDDIKREFKRMAERLKAEKRRQREENRDRGKNTQCSTKRDAANPGGSSVMLCVIAGLLLSTYCWKQLISNNYETETSESLRASAEAMLKEEACETGEIKEFIPPYTVRGLKTCAECETDQRHEDEQDSDRAEQSRQKQETQSDHNQQSGGGQQEGGDQGGGQQGGGGQGGGQQGGGGQGDQDSDGEVEESESEEETDDDKKKTRKKQKTKQQSQTQRQDHRSGEDQESVCSINEESKCELDTNQNRPVNIALLNLRSMRRFNISVRILELITRFNISIFLTTETWLSTSNVHRFLSEASPANFRYFYFTRPSRGGGVAIQFSPEFQDEQISFNYIITSFEFVAGVLLHEDWDGPVLIINLYRPPRCSVKEFLNALQNILNEVSKNHKNIIVTGDFNIWVDDAKRGRMFKRFLQYNDLVQHVRERTHRGNHTLDLVLTRGVEISDVEVRNDGISDHYTVSFKARPKKTEEKKDEDENRKRYKKSEE